MAEIYHIFSSLVPPGKHEATIEIRGSSITLEGKLYGMLANIYDKADEECNIPIRFLPARDGTQNNEVRSAIVDLVEDPTLDKATALAHRLSGVSTGRSGLGLLFLIVGKAGDDHKLLISRFPANPGILAEASDKGLSVELVEKVFMKNVASYKAALYRSRVPTAEFWNGAVVDKQLAQMGESAANYWIKEFLQSDLMTTSRAGSRRLAAAMKLAARAATSVDEKHQLISAITLLSGMKDQTVTPREVLDRFGLGPSLRDAVLANLPTPEAADAAFVLDTTEFRSIAAFRTVELDSGGVLTAATDEFDKVFEREVVDSDGAVRFSTVGHVVDERVKGRDR